MLAANPDGFSPPGFFFCGLLGGRQQMIRLNFQKKFTNAPTSANRATSLASKDLQLERLLLAAGNPGKTEAKSDTETETKWASRTALNIAM
jgi:hypothetical protein